MRSAPSTIPSTCLRFGASEAPARLGPALAGTALVLLPAFFRDQFTRGGALAASALLVISSSLLAASRSADGVVLAVLGLSLAAGGLWRALLLRREASASAAADPANTAAPGTAAGPATKTAAATWLYVASVGLG